MSAPTLAALGHPTFSVGGFDQGLDRLFAAASFIHEVHFTFWVDLVGDDPSAVIHAEVTFRGSDEHPYVEEERLDEIAAVRFLERQAKLLWSKLPLEWSEDVCINGAYTMVATKTSVRFELDTAALRDTIILGAELKDGEWISVNQMIMKCDDRLREMALTDPNKAIEAISFENHGDVNFASRPTVSDVTVDGNKLILDIPIDGFEFDKADYS